MHIYNQEKLKEHIEYGEYINSGELITPPHPECQVNLLIIISFAKLNSLMMKAYIGM